MANYSNNPDATAASQIKRAAIPARRNRKFREYVAHYLAWLRNWRSIFTRGKLLEQLRMMAVVIPLTLLIWVYAERGQIVDVPNVNVAVKIMSSDPNVFVDSQSSVNLKLSGPQDAIETVKNQLSLQHGLSIDLGQIKGGRDQAVEIVNRIQNYPIFKYNGVTVVEAQPSQVSVNIDLKDRIELPVEIPPEMTNLSKESRFDPPRIFVSGPSTLLRRGRLHVYARVGAMKDPGEQPPRVVPVELFPESPDNAKLQLSATQVTANLVVQASDVPYTIDSVPILVQGSPDILNSNVVRVNNGGAQAITEVQVIGPPSQIERLRNKDPDSLPYAILDIAPGDADREGSKPLRYQLPPGVRVNPDDVEANRPIPFKLTSR